jgi:glutathione S-transferase
MKLYYAPNTCSLAPQIVAAEAGITVDLERVDLRTHLTETGADYRTVNALGYVPALRLDDGELLTEGTVIVQYLADSAPDSKLAPPPGTVERLRLQQWLNLIATELHKAFSPWLFHPEVGATAQSYAKARIVDRLGFIDRRLADSPFLMGETFTVADAYFYTIVGWSRLAGIDIAPYPRLGRYMDRIAARPKVRAAMQAQRLSKAA